jgi:hypothetical protein
MFVPLLDASFFVVVLWIGDPTLPIHLTL